MEMVGCIWGPGVYAWNRGFWAWGESFRRSNEHRAEPRFGSRLGRKGRHGMELVTKQEKEALEARLKALLSNRQAVAQRIAEARELGDLKENGDYHAAREQQGMEEAEIRRLTERLAAVSVVDESRKSAGVVFLGATVKLREDGSEDLEVFKMVGEFSGQDTGDVVEVTPTSPMGEALMKARVGEVVAVRTPRGVKRFEIVEIL